MNKINFESFSKVLARFFILMYITLLLIYRWKDILELDYVCILFLLAITIFFFLVKKMGIIELTFFNSFIMSGVVLTIILWMCKMCDLSFLGMMLEGWGFPLATLILSAILFTLILLIRFKFKSKQ